jgi:hypothetical protein
MTALSPLGILQVIPYAKNAPLGELMRGAIAAFAFAQLVQPATRLRTMLYIRETAKSHRKCLGSRGGDGPRNELSTHKT